MADYPINGPDNPSPQMHSVAPILILGIGNILMGDDGVGIRVVERLHTWRMPPHVEVITGETMGFGLWHCLSGRRKIIVVDAIDLGETPGHVSRLDGHLDTPDAISIHQLSIPSLVHILGCMENAAPPEIIIVGVQPKLIVPSLSLSPEVEARINEAVHTIYREATRAIGQMG
jgi:hydrogenase maturation protease